MSAIVHWQMIVHGFHLAHVEAICPYAVWCHQQPSALRLPGRGEVLAAGVALEDARAVAHVPRREPEEGVVYNDGKDDPENYEDDEWGEDFDEWNAAEPPVIDFYHADDGEMRVCPELPVCARATQRWRHCAGALCQREAPYAPGATVAMRIQKDPGP